MYKEDLYVQKYVIDLFMELVIRFCIPLSVTRRSAEEREMQNVNNVGTKKKRAEEWEKKLQRSYRGSDLSSSELTCKRGVGFWPVAEM